MATCKIDTHCSLSHAPKHGIDLLACLGAVESALDNLDDKVSVEMISEIIDWVKGDALLHTITDPGCTFLCGHSRVRGCARLCQGVLVGMRHTHVAQPTCCRKSHAHGPAWHSCAAFVPTLTL